MGRRAQAQRRATGAGPDRAVVAVALGVVAAALGGALVSFRVGGLLMALVLVAVALARVVLPVAVLGPLAVRSRLVDVVTCLLFAASLALLAVIAPPGTMPLR